MAAVVAHPAPSAPIDTDALRSTFADADDLLREIVQLFLAECPRRIAEMQRALAAGDCQALRLVAHSLKGSLHTLGARRAAAAAQVLESTADTGDLGLAADACIMLEEELACTTPALARLARAPEATPAPHAGDDHGPTATHELPHRPNP